MHAGIERDERQIASIPEAERCKLCGGSGNELYSMYHECRSCKGDGRSRGDEHQFESFTDYFRKKCEALSQGKSEVP